MEEEIQEIKMDGTGFPTAQKGMPVAGSRFPWLAKIKEKFRGGKAPKILLSVVIVLLVLFGIFGILVGIPLFKAYNDGKKAYILALGIKDATKTQDIKMTTDAIIAAENQVKVVQDDLKPIGWTKYLPVVGGYTSDLTHFVNAGESGLEAAEIFARAVEPYADILGLKGQGTFAGGTAEDRIALAVATLGKVTPQIDAVADKMTTVKKEIDQVDPNRYPESFQGKPIRSTIAAAKSAIDLVGDLLTEARPMVKKLPDLLGANGERKYLILFQNDKELRPTGGFITAYAVFRIDKGKINLDSSNDIYKLDDTITLHVAPPEQISKYLNVYGWRLRDSNFSPDFYSSMRTFGDLYNSSTDKKEISGILAMDTQVLVDIMNVLGPIPAYGTNFTTDKMPGCNCPMVIYELEKYADQPTGYERGNRKDIIGILLQSILHKALSAPKQIYGQLFQTGLADAQQKHLLIYLHDPDAQKGLEALNWAGRIKTYNGDYLHVNDANLGGAKSNLYIAQSVKQDTSITDDGARTTLTLEYKYPHEADNCSLERKEGLCLAGIYRDYVRVLLPKGATVGEVRGFESQSSTFDSLDHTVVDGFFTVVPQGLARIQITYRVSGNFKKTGEYRELIQKQPGTNANHYKITINGKLQEFDLRQDKELIVKL